MEREKATSACGASTLRCARLPTQTAALRTHLMASARKETARAFKRKQGRGASDTNIISLGSFPCFQKQTHVLLNGPAEPDFMTSLGWPHLGQLQGGCRLRQCRGPWGPDSPTHPTFSTAPEPGKLRKAKPRHLFSLCHPKPAKPAVSVVTGNPHECKFQVQEAPIAKL